MTDWTHTRDAFRQLAWQVGIATMAQRIPANKATVYRIIKGETRQPSRAVRASIEKIVKEKPSA